MNNILTIQQLTGFICNLVQKVKHCIYRPLIRRGRVATVYVGKEITLGLDNG